jgi:hypothetical protein
MNLGYNGEKKAIWDKYDPDQSSYSVPTPIIAAIGGGYVHHRLIVRLSLLMGLQAYRSSY